MFTRSSNMSPLHLITLQFLTVYVNVNGAVKITVEEDSDVVLPCSLSSKENLESKLFDWKKDAHMEVFLYDAGAIYGNGFAGQDKQLEGRVSHFPHELKNGNASIKITKTKVSDSGNYTCVFPRLQPRQTFSIQLVVGTCPRLAVSALNDTKDGSLLQCVVQGASPKPVVEWTDSSGNILPAKEAQVTERGGSYAIILQTTVTKTDSYSCVVKQEEICHQVYDSVFVFIHEPDPPTGWMVSTWILAALLVLVLGVSLLKKWVSRKKERINAEISYHVTNMEKLRFELEDREDISKNHL